MGFSAVGSLFSDSLLVLQPVSSVTNKSVIPEVFYRESIAEYGFPISDFGNDERLVGYELRVVTLESS
jgi:hypothetical protein